MKGDRRFAGIMKGFDQYMNIVLDEAIKKLKRLSPEWTSQLSQTATGHDRAQGVSPCNSG